MQSIPWDPNLETHFCVVFITPLLEEVFFLILLSWGCTSKFNLTQLLSICWWRNLKSSLQLKRPDKILSFFSAEHWEQWSMYRLANCMLITSSMCPIQLFQTRFQLHCRHKNFNSHWKEEHLKGNRDWNVFCAHFTMDPDSQSPVWCSNTT